ncbi:MAG: NAD(P)H-hydrate dehydratase [Phycisphaeraceae bacterium]
MPDLVQAIPAAPPRPADAHKGTFGTVIVVGGSATMIGAPALCATAAFRSGAGLVKLATLPQVLPFAIAIEPGATGIVLDGDAMRAVDALDDADPDGTAVLAVGPGMGRSDWWSRIVMGLLRGKRTLVLDADGLNLLAATGKPRPAGNDHQPALIMTPHPGEFRRLAKPLGIDDDPTDPQSRSTAAARLAEAHHAIVVLKGQHTVVSDGRRAFVNHTGNPALATAGTGDVLTGCIAALAAQGMPPWDAAVLGVYLHGLAGDLWTAQQGPSGLTSRDLANMLPTAFQQHR